MSARILAPVLPGTQSRLQARRSTVGEVTDRSQRRTPISDRTPVVISVTSDRSHVRHGTETSLASSRGPSKESQLSSRSSPMTNSHRNLQPWSNSQVVRQDSEKSIKALLSGRSVNSDRSQLGTVSERELQRDPHVRKRGFYEALYYLLESGGLPETAAVLNEEARLDAEPNSSHDGGHSVILRSKLAKAMSRHCSDVVAEEAVQQENADGLKSELSTQKLRLQKLHEVLKGLRGHLEASAKSAFEDRALAAAQRAEWAAKLADRTMEIEESRKKLLNRKAAQAMLEKQLKAAEANLARLRECGEELPREKGQDMFDLLDTDGDGKLSREEFKAGIKAMKDQVQKIHDIAEHWDAPGGGKACAEASFDEVDADGDRCLLWSNDEIRAFARTFFRKMGIALPPWQDHVWYDLYCSADIDCSLSLELPEAIRFVRQCLDSTLATLLRSPILAKADDRAVARCEAWAKTYRPKPIGNVSVTYSNGVKLDLNEFRAYLPVQAANAPHRARMVQAIERGEHIRNAMQAFQTCDRDLSGCLTWNDGEIRDFVTIVFRAHGLTPPPEEMMFRIYKVFDSDNNSALDSIECAEFVDALLRTLFSAERGAITMGGCGGRVMSPVRYETPQITMPLQAVMQPLGPQTAHSRGSSPVSGLLAHSGSGVLAVMQPVGPQTAHSRGSSPVSGLLAHSGSGVLVRGNSPCGSPCGSGPLSPHQQPQIFQPQQVRCTSPGGSSGGSPVSAHVVQPQFFQPQQATYGSSVRVASPRSLAAGATRFISAPSIQPGSARGCTSLLPSVDEASAATGSSFRIGSPVPHPPHQQQYLLNPQQVFGGSIPRGLSPPPTQAAQSARRISWPQLPSMCGGELTTLDQAFGSGHQRGQSPAPMDALGRPAARCPTWSAGSSHRMMSPLTRVDCGVQLTRVDEVSVSNAHWVPPTISRMQSLPISNAGSVRSSIGSQLSGADGAPLSARELQQRLSAATKAVEAITMDTVKGTNAATPRAANR